MINSILKKEWLKLKNIILILALINIITVTYFIYNLNFTFKTTEPESMVWYQFVNFDTKPYFYFSLLFLLNSIVISCFQYIPERIKNRVKIITHLPISIEKSVFFHSFIACLFIFLIEFFTIIFILIATKLYYPDELVIFAAKDLFFYFLGSFLVYLGISSVIIEKSNKYAFIKLLFTVFTLFIYHKSSYTNIDLLYIFFVFLFFAFFIDSFYYVKEQRIRKIILIPSLFISVFVLGIFSYSSYENKYKFDFNKYYIFYSPILKEFVYQKNFGEHHFEYGIKDKKTFSREEYESYLPFVYWRNLDIQKNLPITIENETFDKRTIKNSRLSFSYRPEDLKDEKTKLFPLINPDKNIGIIKFPEEMFFVNKEKIKVYNPDTRLDENLTKEINQLLLKENFTFPSKGIWGKTTNMKPYDLGYFILDSKNQLFNFYRANNKLYVKKIAIPDMKLEFIKISENKQKKFIGYAITKDTSFYLIEYETFKFRKIELKNFDYKTMKLQLISNPKHYLIRYDDAQNYHAVVLNKSLEKIAEDVF